MENKVFSIIKKYYLNSSMLADQNEKLELEKKKAHQGVGKIVEQLSSEFKSKFSLNDLRVVPYLGKEGTDVCYIIEVLLNKGCNFFEYNDLGDRKTLQQTRGVIKTLTIYISILGPFAAYEITHSWLDSEDIWKWENRYEFNEDETTIWSFIKMFLGDKGIRFLDYSFLKQKVFGVNLETKEKNEVEVFHCLFTELYSI